MTDSTDETRPARKPRAPSAKGRALYRDAALRQGRGFTPDKQAEYLEHLCSGIPRGASAKLVGVALKTVADYRKKDPAFADAEVEAEATATEPAETKLRDMALDGHMVALMFYLQNRNPDRWKDMRQRQTTVKHEGTVQIEPGQQMQNIMALQAKLAERAALLSGPDPNVIDADVLEDDESPDA